MLHAVHVWLRGALPSLTCDDLVLRPQRLAQVLGRPALQGSPVRRAVRQQYGAVGQLVLLPELRWRQALAPARSKEHRVVVVVRVPG